MKKVKVKVKPSSKFNLVNENVFGDLIVNVKEPAKDNRANNELIEILANHYKVPKSLIKIISGNKSKNKVVKIEKQ